MSKAIAALLRGHDYQGRFFWTKAAGLRIPGTHIIRVGYEFDDLKSFDDVVVWYGTPQTDEFYQLVEVDYYQIKFRIRGNKPFTCESLLDPRFIGAKTHSLLQALRKAVERQRGRGQRARFIVVAPAPATGILREVLSNDAGAILFDHFFKGRRGELPALRKAWRDHLGLGSDQELRTILAPLRFRTDFPTLEGLREKEQRSERARTR